MPAVTGLLDELDLGAELAGDFGAGLLVERPAFRLRQVGIGAAHDEVFCARPSASGRPLPRS